jgi:hypothetical protein
MGEFPSMTMAVGDKTFECPTAAQKAADAAHGKIVYVVAGEKFDCQEKASEALAAQSERFVKRFTTIACVVDGKVMYCDDEGETSCSKTKTASASKSGSCKSGTSAKTAAAKGKGDGCCKSKSEAKTASAKGDGCCHKAKSMKFMVLGRTFDKHDEAVKAHDDAMTALKTVTIKYIVDGEEVKDCSQVCPIAKKAGRVTYVVNQAKMKCDIEARIAAARAQYDAAREFASKKLAKA